MKYRCKELRIDRDIKQRTIANFLGISQASYSDLENEKTMLTADYIIKLCRFYSVSADYILGLTKKPNSWHSPQLFGARSY